MYERYHEQLAPTHKFVYRLMRSIGIGIIMVIIAELVGMWGYHHFEKMGWVDAFANAAMILSGMGPLTPLNTTGGKLFAGFYALFSGLAFILIIGFILTPVAHRFLHHFHLESTKK